MEKFEILKRQLSEGRIGRRQFILQTAALGMTAAIPAGILTEEAQAAAPKRGGRLRQGVRGGSATDTLETQTILDTHTWQTNFQIRNTLIEQTPEGSFAGDLAESWEPSPDASRWAFKLRKGVEFHNGKTLDAQDVVYSLNLHRGEGTKSMAANLVNRIDDVKTDGKDTVIVTLKEGNADFTAVLADPRLSIAIDGTKGSQEWNKGIGTGPFTLVDWEPGVRAFTKRNPNYFKEGKPYFDEVETLNVVDPVARINALRSGVVDVIDDPEVKTLSRLAQTPGIRIIEVASAKHFTFPMHMDVAPFDDNDVRLAIKYGIDREALLDTILRGHGYVGNDHPVGRAQRYFASELPQRARDLDKAKFHLKKAGHSELSLKIHSSDGLYPGAVDAVVLIADQLAPVGIKLEVARVPSDGYWSNVWNKKAWCASYWSARATEDLILSGGYFSESSENETHWKNSHFDDLLKRARAELDEKKRGKMYVEMQELLHFEGGALIPLFANYLMATNDKIQTPEKIASNWVLDGNRNSERWWFA